LNVGGVENADFLFPDVFGVAFWGKEYYNLYRIFWPFCAQNWTLSRKLKRIIILNIFR